MGGSSLGKNNKGRKFPAQAGAADPRRLAVRSLVKWENSGKYVPIETASTLSRAALSDTDRRFYTALVYGVVERAVTLDYVIGKFSARPTDEIDPEVRTLLRLGLYQLMFMDRVPDHAAVSSTVDLAPRRAAGFVNALLRSFIRAGGRYDLPTRAESPLAYLSVKYSIPEELCGFFVEAYGESEAERILAASVGDGRICLRVNTLKLTLEAAEAKVRACGGECRRSDLSPEVLILPHGADFLSGIDDGSWFVQDEASSAAIDVLAPVPGSTVVDLCSAPGGKSFSAAMHMCGRGRIYSFDIHENKLSLVRDGALRLGADIITAAAGDARRPPEKLCGMADFVICDAPCSGLGVISKKPDIRYKSVKDIAALPDVQYEILCGAAKCVKPGGALLYSTCTLAPAENGGVVERFLASHPEFEAENFALAGEVHHGSVTLFPHIHGCDGFFISKMRRRTEKEIL